jgi:hypothetical protein
MFAQRVYTHKLILNFLVKTGKFSFKRKVLFRFFFGKQIASTTPQVWLVAGSHLGFAKKSFHSIASDKNCVASVKTGCHGERLLVSRPSVGKLSWQGDYHAVLSARLVMTRSG